jgi:hypothetical protein
MNNRRQSLAQLFKIEGTEDSREEQGVGLLRELVVVSVVPTTATVQISIATKWRSVSLQLVQALMRAINDYDTRTRQSQGSIERRFVEKRLAMAKVDLRASEDAIENFLRGNRELRSVELSMERDRLQRELAFRQQVMISLTQALEEARIREVRDTPVITVFEAPSVPILPEPRGRVTLLLLGAVLGGLAAVLAVFAGEAVNRRRAGGTGDVGEFMTALAETKEGLVKYVPAEFVAVLRRTRARLVHLVPWLRGGAAS